VEPARLWPTRQKRKLLGVVTFRVAIDQPQNQRSCVNGSKAIFLALFIAVVSLR
jgi:hypothetical protein